MITKCFFTDFDPLPRPLEPSIHVKKLQEIEVWERTIWKKWDDAGLSSWLKMCHTHSLVNTS